MTFFKALMEINNNKFRIHFTFRWIAAFFVSNYHYSHKRFVFMIFKIKLGRFFKKSNYFVCEGLWKYRKKHSKIWIRNPIRTVKTSLENPKNFLFSYCKYSSNALKRRFCRKYSANFKKLIILFPSYQKCKLCWRFVKI